MSQQLQPPVEIYRSGALEHIHTLEKIADKARLKTCRKCGCLRTRHDLKTGLCRCGCDARRCGNNKKKRAGMDLSQLVDLEAGE